MTFLANAFDASSCAPAALGAKTIGQPGRGGCLGPDDREADPGHVRGVGEPIEIIRRNREILCQLLRSRVSGGAIHLGVCILTVQRRADRMLPTSAAQQLSRYA